MSDMTASPEIDLGRTAARGMADHPLVQLTLMRFREFLREPEALFWAFAFPILLAIGLGIAFRNRPAEVIKVAVETPELAQSLRSEKQLDVEILAPGAAAKALGTGKVALLAVPGEGGSVVYRYDDTNPEGRTARMLANAAVERSAGRKDPVASSDQLVREPGSRYIDFLIPGLLGMTLMGNAVWSTGFAIVDARRKSLMKRLMATPMPRHYYLLSFLLARLALLVVEVSVLVGFGAVVFGVPVRGGIGGLVVLCLLGSFCFCAFGLLLASRARTIEAVSGLMNVTMMPMWIVSGVFFSAERFPNVLQPLIKALPLTAAIDGLRANMLQGSSLAAVAPELGILGIWLVGCFSLALWLFRWR
ncbi:MAG: ABC transporter permease [Acidobacteriia bacterium]|nr:ABC transporter permease [Terriglobia bacterium]MBV8903928.1 ABC transporter permease [Terriglobia bacterium]MBV9745722.1 ABC transporter permease [Terriglobia bacterium]